MKKFFLFGIIACMAVAASAWVNDDKLNISRYKDSIHCANLGIATDGLVSRGNALAWGYRYSYDDCPVNFRRVNVYSTDFANVAYKPVALAGYQADAKNSAAGIVMDDTRCPSLIISQNADIYDAKIYYYVYNNGGSSLSYHRGVAGGSATETITTNGTAKLHVLTIKPAVPISTMQVDFNVEEDSPNGLPLAHPLVEDCKALWGQPVIIVTDIAVRSASVPANTYDLPMQFALAANQKANLTAERDLLYQYYSRSKADVNGDGAINVTDVVNVYNAAILGETKTEKSGHEYVDLDLPSGICWATANMGASLPEANGDYYAFNEMAGWSYLSNKPVFTEQNYIADPHVQITPGGVVNRISDQSWRDWFIPSLEQWAELFDKAYTTQESVEQNGVRGIRITSIKNGKSIFLPAGGFVDGQGLRSAGSEGYYWTSKLSAGSTTSANAVSFRSPSTNINSQYEYIYKGLNIRAVCRK